MVLAVYMPPHEPAPGHASHSMAWTPLRIELAGLMSAYRLEDRHDVDVAAVGSDAGQDAAAVDEDAGNVEPRHGHDAAGHVLVAAAEGEQAIVIHAAGHDFETVGDDLARDEAVAHALMAHHNAVGGGGRAENLRHAAAGANAFAAAAGQAIEMGVARRNLAEQRSDADHRPIEILIVKADGPQHGAIGSAAGTFGGESAGTVALGRHGHLRCGRMAEKRGGSITVGRAAAGGNARRTYSSLPRRFALSAERRFFAAKRRSWEPRDGFVLRRGFGVTAAARSISRNFSRQSRRLRS